MASESIMGMSAVQLIGIAVVVVVVVVGGFVLLTGHNSGTSYTSVTTAATTTAAAYGTPTSTAQATTVQQSNNPTPLESLAGQNVSLSSFISDFGSSTFSKVNTLNTTYNYKYTFTLTGKSAYTINGTGTTTMEKYYNDSRIVTTSSVSGESILSTLIYNSAAKQSYACSSINGGPTSCYLTATNVSLGSGGSLSFIGSEAGSNTVLTGYYNKIALSSSSVNGKPCTLVTGNVYIKAEAKNGTASAVLQGVMNSCVSTQDNTWLSQSLVGSMTLTSPSRTTNGNLNYTMSEVSTGAATTQSITALPGPVTST